MVTKSQQKRLIIIGILLCFAGIKTANEWKTFAQVQQQKKMIFNWFEIILPRGSRLPPADKLTPPCNANHLNILKEHFFDKNGVLKPLKGVLGREEDSQVIRNWLLKEPVKASGDLIDPANSTTPIAARILSNQEVPEKGTYTFVIELEFNLNLSKVSDLIPSGKNGDGNPILSHDIEISSGSLSFKIKELNQTEACSVTAPLTLQNASSKTMFRVSYDVNAKSKPLDPEVVAYLQQRNQKPSSEALAGSTKKSTAEEKAKATSGGALATAQGATSPTRTQESENTAKPSGLPAAEPEQTTQIESDVDQQAGTQGSVQEKALNQAPLYVMAQGNNSPEKRTPVQIKKGSAGPSPCGVIRGGDNTLFFLLALLFRIRRKRVDRIL